MHTDFVGVQILEENIIFKARHLHRVLSELFVNDENGELESHSIRSIAHDIRSSWLLEDEDLSHENDVNLVRNALSVEGIDIRGGYYYSLCRKSLQEQSQTWHLWKVCRLERMAL